MGVAGYKPTAHVEIDSTKCDAAKLALIEAALFGSDEADVVSQISAKVPSYDGNPMLLLPNDLVALLGN